MSKPSSLRGPAAFALRHGRAIMLVVAGFCLWGVAAFFILPSGIYPNVHLPRIVVIAERGEDAVENMMVAVTRPLEDAAGAVDGLSRVRSKTIRGASEITLDFLPSTDMREALSQTRARAAAAVAALTPPPELTIEQQTPAIFPVISFNVSLTTPTERMRDGADLMDWANLTLKPLISRLPDVFRVTVQGADARQILIEADPARLAASGLTLEEISKAVGEANEVGSVGILEKNYKQFQLLASSEIKRPEEMENLPVATKSGQMVRLGDVAKVSLGVADRTTIVTGNGKDSVVVSVFMRYGGKITTLSENVKRMLEEVRPSVPRGIALTPVYDNADLVRASMGGVRDAILIGVALTIIVLWLFLRSWRLTTVAAVSIPISILATFAILWMMGESLNLMSLGGIAVAIGLIIDDAIVVVENIARRVHGVTGPGRGRAVVLATGEILGAVVGSSMTTVVVFLPLVLLEGVVGQFFRALAIALAIGILVSMVVSLTLAPLMAAGRLGPKPDEITSRPWIERLSRRYESLARFILRRPGLSAVALILVIGAGGLVVLRQATGFLPEMDEGAFVLDYFMPVGTSLGETDKTCRKIEAILAQIPEVAAFSRRTGAELGFFATEQFTGDFLIGLKPFGERERDCTEVIEDVRHRINEAIPQVKVEFVQVLQDTLNDMAGNPTPLEAKIFGSDYKTIQTVAAKATSMMEKTGGVVDVSSGVSFGAPEITYRIDTAAASRAGLTSADVEKQLKAAILGEKATDLRQGERLVPVWLRYPDAYRRDPAWLATLPLADGAGRPIPATLVSRVEERSATNELTRENQQPEVSVTAGIEGVDLGTAARRVREGLDKLEKPAGVRIELGGQIESQNKAFANLMVVLALACGLVFLLLVIQFRSYRLPFIIFLTLPPSQIGGLLALKLTGTALNISSFMGLVMLVGLVVKNGIIFIEYTAQLREQGEPSLAEALVHAGRVRLRPILMTSLAAIIAMAPLALNIGAGAELQRPLAIAVIGGLSVSTLFTLLIIPVAHLLLGEPELHSALLDEEGE